MDPNSKEGYTVIGGDDDEAIPIGDEENPTWLELPAALLGELMSLAEKRGHPTVQTYLANIVEREIEIDATIASLKARGIL